MTMPSRCWRYSDFSPKKSEEIYEKAELRILTNQSIHPHDIDNVRGGIFWRV